MQTWFFDSQSPESTFEVAVELGRSIGRDGLVLALTGPLGAGKTVFVKGLAEGLGIDCRAVSSPTFVIAQQYPIASGPDALHHVDLYRLESPEELESIGFDDMLAKNQVLAVEWADRFPGVLGRKFLAIEFAGPTPAEEDAKREGTPWQGRRAEVTAHGEHAEHVLSDWAGRCESIQKTSAGFAPGITPAMRILAICWVAILSNSYGAFDAEEAKPTCQTFVGTDADILGTLRARCEKEGGSEIPKLTGMGRLLAGQPIDLNEASARLLRALPQIGTVRANAIVATRESREGGRFEQVGDLEDTSGIGPKTRARVERWLYIRAIETPPGSQERLRHRDG